VFFNSHIINSDRLAIKVTLLGDMTFFIVKLTYKAVKMKVSSYNLNTCSIWECSLLTEKDEELLSILRLNARASVSDIARATGVSRTAIQNRLNKLENNNVIKAYSVVLDSAYTSGLISSNVSLKVKPNLRQTICIALRKVHQISHIHSISGEYDLLVTIQASTLEKLSEVLNMVCSTEGVERTNSAIILDTIFER
jgi:DNA-binding Lrp family transcriptional regulator